MGPSSSSPVSLTCLVLPLDLWVTSLRLMGMWGISVLSMLPTALGSSQPPRIHPNPVCLWLSPQSGRSLSYSHPPLPIFYFSNEFSRMVAGEYLKFFVFTGMSLDQALRSELSACIYVHVRWPPKRGPSRLCHLQLHTCTEICRSRQTPWLPPGDPLAC